MTRLVEIHETSQGHVLREIYVNPKHVVSLREDMRFKQKLSEGKLPEELNDQHSFTKVTLDKGSTGQELVVVGAPHAIEAKLNGDGKQLLNG